MLIAMFLVFLENVQMVASITDFATFAVYFFVNASAIALRFTMPDVKRDFRMPLNVGKLPVLSVLGLFTIIALASHLELITILIGFAIFLSAVPLYYIFNKKSGMKI
jgi:APA family basic amino acid/polyamine antiporter